MTKNLILPPVNFALVIARVLEDYVPEGTLLHSLTDQQVSNMYSDLVSGCESAYENASARAEEAIKKVYMQEEGEYRGIDPYDLPMNDEEPIKEDVFCATRVLREAMSDMKNADGEDDDNEGSIKYIYR